ncbi:hypothetical protein ACOSP7_001394 [Xanthoceras sorbifolium]
MAADAILSVKAHRNVQGFATILTSTACEWFLIFLLLINAVFSYLSTKFARYCQLQLPCIFCSRLDHVLGNEKHEFYRNLLCSNHRSEISSLVSCHIHGKLADGHDMCDDCLFSFSKKSNSNLEMNKLVLGKLGFDIIGCCGPQSSLLNCDFVPVSMSKRLCSCCNKPWRSRQNVQRLLQFKSPVPRVSKPNIPLPRRLSHRDGLKKIRDKFSGQAVPPRRVGKSTFDPLSHVGYSELKISSDSESEFPFSDDDDGRSVIRDINEAKNSSKPHDTKCSSPDVSSWQELGELNLQQPDQKTHPSPLPQLISLDDISSPSNTLEAPMGVSPLSQSLNAPTPAELISLVDMNPSFDVVEIPVNKAANVTGTTDARHVSRNHHEEILKLLNSTAGAANVTGTTETQHNSINHHEEILKLLNTAAGTGIINDQILSSPAPVNPTYEDPNDVHKTAVCGKGRETSGFVVPTEKECDRFTEDLIPLTQDSSAQGIPLSMNNTSPTGQGYGDDSGAPSSSGIQNFQKSSLVERTDSASLESLDGSTVSEIEGESTIDRLKRQVEYDRKCMNALYKELDEERSASAIAANQAMAMITRLQEEKAALHMEALQYLRMMEEQAEYDVEALEKANDLLAEKEKEIQDLEAQIEYYRFNNPDESMETIYEEKSDSKKENVNVENMSLNQSKDDANIPCDLYSSSKGSDNPDALTFIWSELEDEKLYILQSLKSLESKLQRFARYGTVHDISNNECFEAAAEVVHNQGEIPDKDWTLISRQMEENDLPVQNDLPVANGNTPAQEGSSASISKDQVVSKENNHSTKVDLVALEYEISDLNERLEALEIDCNLLEHTCNFLQNGNEGLQFIQQIARQLQELRKIGIRCMCRSVP